MALPTKITLEIVTPDRLIVREEVDEIQVPGSEGYFGILPGHSPLLATMKVGELWYRLGREHHYLAIAGGFVEVLPDRVAILAQIAERAEEIDVTRAEAARKRAEERMAVFLSAGYAGLREAAKKRSEERVGEPQADLDFESARTAMSKALVRLQVAQRARTRV